MVFKYIFLVCLFLGIAIASPAPAPEPEPEALALADPGCPSCGLPLPVIPPCGFFYITSGSFFFLNVVDIISIFISLDLSSLLGSLNILRIATIDIMIKLLQARVVITGGHFLILNILTQTVEFVDIEILIKICRGTLAGYTKGILIFNSLYNIGTVVDLTTVISTGVTTISTDIAIGQLIEVALSRLRKPCGCSSLICIPKILIIETTVCKVRCPVDWFWGLGKWLRPNICPICV